MISTTLYATDELSLDIAFYIDKMSVCFVVWICALYMAHEKKKKNKINKTIARSRKDAASTGSYFPRFFCVLWICIEMSSEIYSSHWLNSKHFIAYTSHCVEKKKNAAHKLNFIIFVHMIEKPGLPVVAITVSIILINWPLKTNTSLILNYINIIKMSYVMHWWPHYFGWFVLGSRESPLTVFFPPNDNAHVRSRTFTICFFFFCFFWFVVCFVATVISRVCRCSTSIASVAAVSKNLYVQQSFRSFQF